tara:strand:+ start:4951 stop:5187 length:237 start_codon:yes stop_codon:yes gene_type:complete
MEDKNKEVIKSLISLIRENKVDVERVTRNITVIKEVVGNLTEEEKEQVGKLAQEKGSDLEKLAGEYLKVMTELENILK